MGIGCVCHREGGWVYGHWLFVSSRRGLGIWALVVCVIARELATVAISPFFLE